MRTLILRLLVTWRQQRVDERRAADAGPDESGHVNLDSKTEESD